MRKQELEKKLAELKAELDNLSNEIKSVVEQEKKLPEKWEDLKIVSGFWVDDISRTMKVAENDVCKEDRNIFKTEAQANASVALAQLSQLRDVYRDGWKPDWLNNNVTKHCIVNIEGNIVNRQTYSVRHFLAFQNHLTAELFLKNFRDLIEKASPLLFD
jgi:hypothetical protein